MRTTARLAMISQVLGGSFVAIAFFGFLWMNIPGGGGWIPVFAIVSAAMLAVARQKGNTALAVLSNVRRILPSASPAVWLFGAVVLGISLRIFVAMLFPPVPSGNWNLDMLRYWDLAHKLVEGMDYTTPEGRANWPPGLPLVLVLLLPAFGSSAFLAYNIGTFAITEIATFMLGRMLAGWQAGCLAAFFLAVWPNFVFAAPLLLKECLVIALWPTAAFFYLKACEVLSDKKAGLYALLAGASLGYSALTQPSAMLLPLCLALFSIITNGWHRRTLICVFATAFGFLAVVAPWTVRNYVVLHHFVPIITAGGGNFFMVHRPQSDGRHGGLTDEERNALGADEVAQNERGYLLGIKSIHDYPLHFFSTLAKKPFYLFGQDTKNLYWNFEHEDGREDTPEKYALPYWLSNTFYLGIILLIAMMVMGKQYVRDATPALILPWLFTLYPIFAHSLFEGAERHRYGAFPFLAIFAAMALVMAGRREMLVPALVGMSVPSAGRNLPV